MPKSRAPRDSRFAGIFLRSRQIDAKKQREGDRHGDDERGPDVAQEEEQHDRDEDEAFRQVVQDRVGRVVDEVAPVVEGDDLDARRQDVVVQLLHLLVDALDG